MRAATFYGKYRGTVKNNLDPLGQGRLQVEVTAVLPSGSLSWAMPCAPFAGSGVGFFALPPVGANVWVEFEGGDPGKPIWSGYFWGAGEVPLSPAIEQRKIIKTAGAAITFDDTPGAEGITIETTGGMKLAITARGIEIDNGQGARIALTGAQVSINDGALEVT